MEIELKSGAKVEFVANEQNILAALKQFCNRIGVDPQKVKKEIDICVSDVAYSIYVGNYKLVVG